jgi:hypothetical protein
MATAHAQAERLLKEIAIPHVVLRMPIVYGIGDRLGLFPRVLCAAVYRRLGEKVAPARVNICSVCALILWLFSVSHSVDWEPQDAHAARH